MNTTKLQIDRLTLGADGVGRDDDGKVIFVPLSAPNDRLVIRRTSVKRRFDRGEIVEILSEGPARVVAPCPVYQSCGGCQWQHVSYEQQLATKEAELTRLLSPLGDDATERLPFKPASTMLNYRHRVRLRFESDERGTVLGYFSPKSHSVTTIESCLIAAAPINRAIAWFRENLSSFVKGKGELELACCPAGLITFTLRGDGFACRISFLRNLVRDTELLRGGLLLRRAERVIFEEPSLTYRAGEHSISWGAGGFVQANLDTNSVLLDVFDSMLQRVGDVKSVVELFCGVGNFTMRLAQLASKVKAIELDKTALSHLKINLAAAGLTNVHAVRDDAERWLKRQSNAPDLIVLDPPRTGAKALIESLRRLGAEYILYVSCNPQTLRRDIANLASGGYRLDAFQGIDMFPQTFHLEVVALMRKISSV